MPTSPLTALEDESGIADTRQWLPTSPLTALEDESGIGDAYQDRNLSNQKNFEIANSMVGGLLENNIIRNPNEETQPYRGIFVDPRTVPEINEVQSNTIYPPTMPAGYDEDGGISLVTTTDKEYEKDVPIVFNQGTTSPVGAPHNVTDNLYSYPDDIAFTVNLNGSNNNNYTNAEMIEQYGPKYNWSVGDYASAGLDAIKNIFKDDSVAPLQGPAGSTASSYTGSIETDPSIWDRTMATIAGASEMPFPANDAVVTDDNFIDLVHSQLPRLTEQGSVDSLNILMEKMAGGLSTDYNSAPGSSSAIDQIVANTILQQQAVQPAAEHPGITAKKNLAAKQAVAQAAAQEEERTQVRERARQPVYTPPVVKPTYTWTPNYAAGRW